MQIFERWFQLRAHGTNIRTEAFAGTTTFLTLSYIFFVQPVILNAAGMDSGAVLVATCLASALGTFSMGMWANYPIALAPGMGHNVFFAYTVCIGMGVPWQTALGATFISAFLFIVLSWFGFRERVINGIPHGLKSAIAVGIGLLIAFVGFQWAGIVVSMPGTLVGLGNLTSSPVVLSLCGFIIMIVMIALRIPGAIIIGILITALLCLAMGLTNYHGIVDTPPSINPTFLQLDLIDPFQRGILTVIFIFFFIDLFDTIGTLVGVTEQAGLLEPDGTLPRARQALLSDALATMGGATAGTSTVTSYIESASGVAAGGRTGLTSVFTAGLMLMTIFFYPLVRMIGEGVTVNDSTVLYPALAPALIIIGILMMRNVKRIEWEEFTEAVPAFLTAVVMPLAFSITEGIAWGFISYALLKLVTGQGRNVHPLLYTFAALFIIRYIWLQA